VVVTADTQTLNAVLIPTTMPATTRTTAIEARSPAQTTSPQITGSGSLLVTTTPPGAQVYVDGGIKGITPTTIPGLSPGAHSIVLKMEGYQDLTTSITITTGQTSEYSTGLSRNAKTPGFEVIAAILSLGVLFVMGRIRH
ncbi:MAG: PEGA domain-containing protein, partial [Methanoregula sp.]|nr:PEGA domain-containing protein [Methanoregula sp.]